MKLSPRIVAAIISGLSAGALPASVHAAPGDILWTIDLPVYGLTGRAPTVAPDGTIYWAAGNELRAENPDGSPRWTYPDAGQVGVVLDAQGFLYTSAWSGPSSAIVKLDPAGNLVWWFPLPSHFNLYGSADDIKLGPDGHVYGVMDGPGYRAPGSAYSIDGISGTLRWDRFGFYQGQAQVVGIPGGAEGRLYVYADRTPITVGPFGSSAGMVAFDLDGNQLWHSLQNTPIYSEYEPIADPTTGGAFFATSSVPPPATIDKHLPDGSRPFTRDWGGMSHWVGAADGSFYVVGDFGEVSRFLSTGEAVYTLRGTRGLTFPGDAGLSSDAPEGGPVLGFGSGREIGWPDQAPTGHYVAVRAGDGSVLFDRPLPRTAEGITVGVLAAPAFSPDGSVMYVLAGSDQPPYHTYLHAIEVQAGRCQADIDADGGVTVDDLLAFLVAFEAGEPAADLDNGTSTGTPDGGVTIDDLLHFTARFEQGC